MQAYKLILIAVDGSPVSDRALQEAITLAQESQAQLRIVHVIDEMALNLDMGFADINETLAYIHTAGKQTLEHAMQQAQDRGIKPESKLVTIETPGMRVGEVIAQEAVDAKADLIVMGTHGRRGISRVFMGSVADTVVRVAVPPVLLVRQ
ncbi:MAG: universal stress protein [Gammaproteobacteria bacterium]